MKNMLKGFLKKGKNTTVSSQELLAQSDEVVTEETISPKLSFHPDWDLSQEEKYVYNFSNFELDPLLPNQVSLSGMDIEYKNDMYTVVAFVRHTLDRTITLGESTLLILNGEGKAIARQKFDLHALGELPPCSSRPHVFVFEEESVLEAPVEEIKDWSIAFEIKKELQHELILHPSWEEQVSEQGKEHLQKIFEQVGMPNNGEVNFVGFQIKTQDNGNLAISVMIRNGNDRDITIEKLPLEVIDSEMNIVAKGGFTLEDFTMRAQSTTPWTFIFPKELVLLENPNLERWAVRVTQ